MKWEKLNPWLNLLGNLAIVLGLIAVAIEIRGNNVALQFQESGILFDRMHEQNALEVDSEVARLYVKSLEEPSKLTKPELWSLTSFVTLRLIRIAQTYVANEAGLLGDLDWRTQVRSLATYLDTPVGRVIWNNLKGDFDGMPEVIEAIDEAIVNGTRARNDEFLQTLYDEVQELQPEPMRKENE